MAKSFVRPDLGHLNAFRTSHPKGYVGDKQADVMFVVISKTMTLFEK